jgi:hypothetical protein
VTALFVDDDGEAGKSAAGKSAAPVREKEDLARRRLVLRAIRLLGHLPNEALPLQAIIRELSRYAL